MRDEVLQYLAQLYANHAPQFIYYKTLFHLFEKYLDEQRQSDLLTDTSQIVDTDTWKMLFEFQRDGVKGAINKILKHNGCVIADSVGLGKTFEALAVIKYFELRNERVLVLCPKKLRENWTIYQAQNNSALNPFVRDRFSYTVLSHTDLSRDGGRSGDIDLTTINWGNYDLVVIDESHNFRNNTPGKKEDGQVIRRSRYQRLMDDIIKSGVKTKVLLLSATPVNNDLSDLRNQLYFLTEGRDDTFRESLGIVSLKDALAVAQRTFSEWAKKSAERKTSELMERLSSAFFTLLDELTIARSRKHIQTYYRETVEKLGGFPARNKPMAIYPDIDLDGLFMSYDKLNDEISQYRLSLFNPSRYVLPLYRHVYETGTVRSFSQGLRESSLIGMMKVNFLKRLESSVHSFALTMQRTIDKIKDLEDRITYFQQIKAGNGEIDIDDLMLPDDALEDEELRDALEVGQKLKFKLAHLDVDTWLKDLKRDKQQIHGLHVQAKDVIAARDAKLAELKRLIRAKVQHPTTNKLGLPNRKVLIFTAFADTAAYLYQALKDWSRDDLGIEIALVSGGTTENKTTFGRNDFNQILTNFSPVSKQRAKMPNMPQDGAIDLLIATDCISEGQNLQDCDYLINYDIHWNPVRIIQRFGRIDRIGSISHAVQLVNFWPTSDLNKYINLKNRVEARMALVDIAATADDNLLASDLEDLITEDLRYRDKQLLRLRDEVLDLEDFSESVALNEFTLDDFRIELAKYIQSNRTLLEESPLGLYAVVPTDARYPVIAPGVIFCLRQKGDTAETQQINPLQPHYLVYVRDDGTVRFGFTQPKQILEMYRTLCAEAAVPYEHLCAAFDQDTRDGADMNLYNDLLAAAARSIERQFRRRSVDQLTAGRDGVIVPQSKQASAVDDFELVTWLVIK